MKYKVWVEVEEVDHEADHYEKCGEPIDIAIFDTEIEASEFQDLLERLAGVLGEHGEGG